MSAHFGGSAAACDRRRRRLVQNTLQGSTLPVGGRSPRSGRGNSSENSEPAETASTPRRKWSLIPRNTRLLGVLCLLNVLAWAGVLWLGCSQWAIDRGLQQFTSLPDGPLIRSFSIFQLLMTSQLSFLIYWYRSRSRKDFMGRYRLWSWAGLFWSMVCLGMVSQAEFGFVRPLLRRFELDSWRPETMSWLLPLAIGVVAVYRVLRRELRQSRLSLTMWEISFSLSVLAAALNLGLDNFLPASIRATCTAAVWSLWHASLAISCLVHLRFVVHITNEAAPRQPSRGTRVLKWSHQHLTQVGERVVTSRPRLRRLRIDTPEATEHPAIKPPRSRLKKKLSEDVAEAKQPTSDPVRSAPKSAKTQSRTDEEPGSSPQSERTWSRWNPFRKTRAAAPESADQAAGANETPLASVPAPHFSLSRLAKRRKSAEPGTESGSTSRKPDSKSDAAITSTASKGWWSRWKKPANADEAAAADAVKTKEQPAKEAKASPVAAAAKPPEKKADLSDEPQAERKGWWSRWKKSAVTEGADPGSVKAKELQTKEVKASPVAAAAKPPEKKADLSDEPQSERKGWWSRWKKSADADGAADVEAVKIKDLKAKEVKASPVAVAAKPPEKKADLSEEPQAERKGWWSRWKKSADAEESASVKTAKSAVTAKAETPKHCEAPARPAPQQTTKPTPPVKKPEPTPVAEKVAEKTSSPAVTAESGKPAGKSWSLGWGSKKSVADSTPPAANKPTTDKPAAAKPAAEKPVTDKPVTKTEASKAPAAAPTMAARPSPAPAPAPAPAPKPAPTPVVSRKPIEDDEREEIPRSEKPRRKPEPMEMEPDDEDGEDYDYSEMSAKERKKLKKRLRQQGRGDRD